MRKFFLVAAFLLVLPPVSFAATPSGQLINDATLFDGSTVSYKGEVVGPIMRRGENVWLSLNDGANAISVWIPVNLLGATRIGGSYGQKGDQISVIGTFHRSCKEHGGALDIHGTYLLMLAQGGPVAEKLAAGKVVWLAVLLGVFVCLLIARIYLKRQKRK